MVGTVFSLVANAASTDARVLRQAKALKEFGFDIHLFGRKSEKYSDTDLVSGVPIIRFNCLDRPRTPIAKECEFLFGKDLFEAFQGTLEQWDQMVCRFEDKFGLYEDHTLPLIRKQGRHVERLKAFIVAIERQIARHELESFYDPLMGEDVLEIAKGELSNLRNLMRSTRSSRPKVSEDFRHEYHAERVALGEPQYFARYAFFALNFFGQHLDQPADVVHVHDLLPLTCAVALKRKYGTKIIYDAHEIETERVPPLPTVRKSFIDSVERACLAYVDELITVSDGCAAFYRERFSRVNVVMNSPEPPHDEQDAGGSIRDMTGLPVETPLIVYTGAVVGEARGVDKVIEALSLLPDYHLAILGPRHQDHDQWLETVLAKSGLAHRVHVFAPVAANLVPVVIGSADVAVCPIQDVSLSYRHSMPNKLFEAAYAGLPICVSDLPDMKAFVEMTGTGLSMDQTDPASIAATITSAYESRADFSTSAEHRLSELEKFSWNAQKQALCDVYNRAQLSPPRCLVPAFDGLDRS